MFLWDAPTSHPEGQVPKNRPQVTSPLPFLPPGLTSLGVCQGRREEQHSSCRPRRDGRTEQLKCLKLLCPPQHRAHTRWAEAAPESQRQLQKAHQCSVPRDCEGLRLAGCNLPSASHYVMNEESLIIWPRGGFSMELSQPAHRTDLLQR